MRTGQHADHGFDRANLIELATVDAGAVLEDGAANDFRFQLLGQLDRGHALLAVEFIRTVMRLDLVAGGIQRVRTGRLVGLLVGSFDVFADHRLDGRLHVFIAILRGNIPRILGGLFGQVDDRIDDRADVVVCESNGAEHFCFGQFLGFRFNHHHCIAGGGNDEIETAVVGQGRGLLRVEDVFAILEADAAGTDRAHEGNA